MYSTFLTLTFTEEQRWRLYVPSGEYCDLTTRQRRKPATIQSEISRFCEGLTKMWERGWNAEFIVHGRRIACLDTFRLNNGQRIQCIRATGEAEHVTQGEAVYIGHHIEKRLDSDSQWRNAIIFELALEALQGKSEHQDSDAEIKPPAINKILSHAPVEMLRTLALNGACDQLTSKSIKTTTYIRSEAIRRYALARANGVCEACDTPAPFLTSRGRPYLEVHHIARVADGGPDHPDKVASLCPNCHRNAHFGQGKELLQARLKRRLLVMEG